MAQKHLGFQWSNPNGAENSQSFQKQQVQGPSGYQNQNRGQPNNRPYQQAGLYQQRPQQAHSSLDDLLYKYIKFTDKKMESQGLALKHLEIQLSQLATLVLEKIQDQSEQQVNNGKNVEIPSELSEEKEVKKKEENNIKKLTDFPVTIPFPKTMKRQKLDNQFSKFLEILKILKQIHINIPSTDALLQMPSFAKFLKEILSSKRKLEEVSVVMLIEKCSAILQNKLPQKLGDPGQEEKLIEVLKTHKGALGWTIEDIKGINPDVCTHIILMKNSYKPIVQPQRRLNPAMQEVVKKEIVKLLAADIIYPISDSPWISPVQVVPNKGGMTVIKNENNELIPTRTVTRWRVYIDYIRLNDATRKDYFSLPFIDQMLERIVGYDFYCFLDGYSRYNQIPIAPEDQDKTTFTCPHGTYVYRRMPFGLCNTPTTFQRCMSTIFSDMTKQILEFFLIDFTLFGKTFEDCLHHLTLVLKRCEETNLILNWEKYYFMVTERIL
ncbi:uncharacterized protein [Nicotiana tomentosiformis]|uniref:uncharacterized protein n=1 Tax=Nicotiana tomentosiformis TaxID=4098 RepID=UPI00388C9E76